MAQTEELFLCFSAAPVPRDAAARVARGLDEETLRAVVDPVWMAASGAFERIHPRDVVPIRGRRRFYEKSACAPRWNERRIAYGM